MYYRTLGLSGLRVSAVGLGCMGMSHAYGAPADKGEMTELLADAVEMGYTFFDTAEMYGTPDRPHDNEELLGEALRRFRDRIVIATKFGISFDCPEAGGTHAVIPDSRPATIRRAVEGSLRRLRTDRIDLYYQHRIDPKVEPEVVAATMKELIKEGKIRAWGISETTEEYLRRANAVCPVTAIENRYSMMARWHESLFPVCEELGITFVAFSPMANGFLTGKYSPKTKFEGSQDYRKQMPQYSEEGYEKGKKILDILTGLAEEKKATLGQLSLAWMLAKKPYIIPIPGSRKLSRLKENLAAADVELTADEVARIDTELDGMDFEVFGGYAAR